MTHRRARRGAGWPVVGILSVTLAGCSYAAANSDPAPRPPSPTRAAAADACTLASRLPHAMGLPLADADTVRIAPTVVGEKLTWRAGVRQVTAWVGIDAPDVFEDLDFVTVKRPPGQPREWTTRVEPDLFLAEASTGHPKPCDRLYVSTEGFPSDAPLKVIRDLRVLMTPGREVADR